MIPAVPAPLRLSIDRQALVSNWRWLAAQSAPARTGAAIKANGYGLGARAVLTALADAGCRDFFVATWAEAADLADLLTPDIALSVLHGLRDDDAPIASAIAAKPVLNTLAQVERWRAMDSGRRCDVMCDTGINRLGLSESDLHQLAGLRIDTVMSHLTSADEDGDLNAFQLERFTQWSALMPGVTRSLANSAGICLGSRYHFDLTRPGLALYGGIPRREAEGRIGQVVTPQAQVLQIREVPAGQGVGYNWQWTAGTPTHVAIVNIGYADGYLRAFSNRGWAKAGDVRLPVIGRVSMDLVALALPPALGLSEGDWIDIGYDLSAASAASGLSPYELLTGLGQRYDRVWR